MPTEPESPDPKVTRGNAVKKRRRSPRDEGSGAFLLGISVPVRSSSPVTGSKICLGNGYLIMLFEPEFELFMEFMLPFMLFSAYSIMRLTI